MTQNVVGTNIIKEEQNVVIYGSQVFKNAKTPETYKNTMQWFQNLIEWAKAAFT